MTTKKRHHHGSTLESLLAEDGILEKARVEATKKVIAARVAQAMDEKSQQCTQGDARRSLHISARVRA